MAHKGESSSLTTNGSPDLGVSNTYSISCVTKAVGVSARQLYYWESIGIIKPVYERFGSYLYRRYSQRDVDFLIKIKTLLNDGYMLRRAVEKVKVLFAEKKLNP